MALGRDEILTTTGDESLTQRKRTRPAPRRRRGSALAALVRGKDVFEIRSRIVRVGREDASKRIYPDVDLTPVDPERTVSRRHAVIFQRGDGWYITEEPGTKHGTYVNYRRIPRSGSEERIVHGDTIRFGEVPCRFLDYT